MRKTTANSTFAIGGVSFPQTVLWLKEVLFSASTFVVKIPSIANLQNVVRHIKKPGNTIALYKLTGLNLDLNLQ